MTTCDLDSAGLAEFIITGMRDNDETLLECLVREMDYFLSCRYPLKKYTCEKFYLANGATFLESEFRKFMIEWNVNTADENFYTDIFMGRKNDMGLSNIS